MQSVSQSAQRALRARAEGAERSVLVHEILDPGEASIEWLESVGVRVTRGCPTWGEQFLSEDELIDLGRGHTALMGASIHRITERVMDALPQLAYISKYGIGVDSIDVPAATRRGILVTNTPIPENWESVAEYTVAAMLALHKQFLFYTTERIRDGGWRTDKAWGSTLRGATVGIVGCGRIGRSVARRLQGWECRILVSDPYVTEAPVGTEQVDLPALLRQADVVSLHAVVTPETYHMIDEAALSLLKPGAILVNSARGALVDLDALHAALASGQVTGAAMDAYEHERPPVAHPIFTLPNVLATPHTSAWVADTFQALARTGAENVHEALSGRWPRFPVNAEVLAGGHLDRQHGDAAGSDVGSPQAPAIGGPRRSRGPDVHPISEEVVRDD